MIWTFAGVLAAASFARGLAMRNNARALAELFWYTIGALILAGAGLLWVSLEGDGVLQQRIVLGVLGALAGAFILVSLGEWIRPSSAQTPPVTPNINGNCNNIGNNNFNCNIIGNLPLPFGDAEKSVLLGNVTKQRKIIISVIADGRAEDLAKKVFDYLKGDGYQVEPISHLMMAAGPNGPPRGVVINNPPDATQPTSIMIGYP
jgi:hypothetical protein